MNVSVMEKGHNLIRERRQGSCNNADLRMCNGCHGFFDRKQILDTKNVLICQGPLLVQLILLNHGEVQNLCV